MHNAQYNHRALIKVFNKSSFVESNAYLCSPQTTVT